MNLKMNINVLNAKPRKRKIKKIGGSTTKLLKNRKKNKIQYDQKRKKTIQKFNYIFITLILLLFIILLLIIMKRKKKRKKLRIGVISIFHDANAGSNLIKYAISVVLKEMGCIPYIIATNQLKINLDFLNKTTNLININEFREVKKEDYDILMVNSDQTWNKLDRNTFNYGFLRFAENWNMTKFVYGASLGHDYWFYSPSETDFAKRLIKQFKGISVREKGSIELIKQHLGITPEFVLDPTLLLGKKYYLDLVKKYSNKTYNNEKYIFLYHIWKNLKMEKFIREAESKLNYKIYNYNLTKDLIIEDFLFYLYNSQAVITDSFHGTVFSIIFNKPFTTFYARTQSVERYKSLGELLQVQNRIFSPSQIPQLNLLVTPPNVDYSIIKEFRAKSLKFIKKNLDI